MHLKDIAWLNYDQFQMVLVFCFFVFLFVFLFFNHGFLYAKDVYLKVFVNRQTSALAEVHVELIQIQKYINT